MINFEMFGYVNDAYSVNLIIIFRQAFRISLFEQIIADELHMDEKIGGFYFKQIQYEIIIYDFYGSSAYFYEHELAGYSAMAKALCRCS